MNFISSSCINTDALDRLFLTVLLHHYDACGFFGFNLLEYRRSIEGVINIQQDVEKC